MSRMIYVMVLNDGETFTTVEGCKILRVEDDNHVDERVKSAARDGITHGDDEVVAEF